MAEAILGLGAAAGGAALGGQAAAGLGLAGAGGVAASVVGRAGGALLAREAFKRVTKDIPEAVGLRESDKEKFKREQKEAIETLDFISNFDTVAHAHKVEAVLNTLLQSKGHYGLGFHLGRGKHTDRRNEIKKDPELKKFVADFIIKNGINFDLPVREIARLITQDGEKVGGLKLNLSSRIKRIAQDKGWKGVKADIPNDELNKRREAISKDLDDILDEVKADSWFQKLQPSQRIAVLDQLRGIYVTTKNDHDIHGATSPESESRAIETLREQLSRLKKDEELIGLTTEQAIQKFRESEKVEFEKEDTQEIENFIEKTKDDPWYKSLVPDAFKSQNRPISKEEKRKIRQSLRDVSKNRYLNAGGDIKEADLFADNIIKQFEQVNRENLKAKHSDTEAFREALKTMNKVSIDETESLSGILGSNETTTRLPFQEVPVELKKPEIPAEELGKLTDKGLQPKTLQFQPNTDSNEGKIAPDVKVGGYDDLLPPISEVQYNNLKFNAFDHVNAYPYINTQTNPLYEKELKRQEMIKRMGFINPTSLDPFKYNDRDGRIQILRGGRGRRYKYRHPPMRYSEDFLQDSDILLQDDFGEDLMMDRDVNEPYSKPTNWNPKLLNKLKTRQVTAGLYHPQDAYASYNLTKFGQLQPNYNEYQMEDKSIDDFTFWRAMR